MITNCSTGSVRAIASIRDAVSWQRWTESSPFLPTIVNNENYNRALIKVLNVEIAVELLKRAGWPCPGTSKN